MPAPHNAPGSSVSRFRPSLSVVVALTRSSGPIPRRVSQQRLRNPAAPFPTRRLSSGWISLLSTGTMKPLRLPMALHAPLRFRSLSATLGYQGDRRLSQLPKGPLYAFALLFDPGPTELAKPFKRSVLPPLSYRTRARTIVQISRLHHTASAPAVYASCRHC